RAAGNAPCRSAGTSPRQSPSTAAARSPSRRTPCGTPATSPFAPGQRSRYPSRHYTIYMVSIGGDFGGQPQSGASLADLAGQLAGEAPVLELDLVDDDMGPLGILAEHVDQGLSHLGHDLGLLLGGGPFEDLHVDEGHGSFAF